MDEINYKLNSRNPALISHAISKLIETTKRKLEDKKDISEISEFKLLTSKCNSDDTIVSTSACQALLLFVQTQLWDAKSAIATLMACLPFAKNHHAVITSVCNLVRLDWTVCDKQNKYTLQVPNQHPFIAILNYEQRSWRYVLHEMSLIMEMYKECERSIEFLRPVFVYVLCDPSMVCSDSCKRDMWQLLISSDNASNLQIEILLWLCTNQENNCIDANRRVLELAELMLLRKNLEYCMMLIPLIASLTIQLLEYGCDPLENFVMIGKLSAIALLDNHYRYVRNITIALMMEIILICPGAHLFKALQICLMLDVKDISCNVMLLNALSAALLKWLAYPSLLCSDALASATFLLNLISAKKESSSNSINVNQMLSMISHSNKYIQFYMELAHNLYSLENEKSHILSWLENLSVAPIDLQYMSKLILCGILLHSCEPLVIQKTCSILVQIAKEINSFASHLLSVLLHKLTRTYDSATIKYLLLAVPELAICKENIPIIIHTLNKILNSEETLKYFAIQLYLKVLDKEPRCYRFLSTALIDTLKDNRGWYADVTCAHAIKYICENRPEYGEELVQLLSQILNRCVDLKGGAATALALSSISDLCKSAVIGIYSTWQIIAPKMRKEKRTVVLESLCELLAEIPSYPHRVSDDYDKLIVDVVTHLWSYVLHQDTKIIESAFKALRSYCLNQVPLSALPQDFQSNLKVPQVSSKKSIDETNKSEDAPRYISGTCWIQMLKKVNKNALSAAGNLLIFYIEDELAAYRLQIYNWPQGEPQNFKYLSEKSVIRAVGEYLRRADKSDSNDQRIIVECLRIFAYKYKKPLPSVNWNFLKATMEISDEAKEYSLSIASRHSQISLSAKQLTESFLSMYTSAQEAGQLLLNKRQIVLYSNLDKLCQAIQPSSLKPFIDTSLAYVIDKMSLNTENSIDLFNCIMSAYVTALKSDAIQVGNRTLLSTTLEGMLEKVDLTSKRYEKYFAAVTEMSVTDIERMTLPSVWWTTTPKKLYNSIIIRTELVFKQCISTPLSWLQDLIALAVTDSKMQEHILRNIQRVQTNLRLEKTCDFATQKDWILDFMGYITTLISEEEINVLLVRLYCDILFVLVICLSGMDCLLSKKELVITSRNVRIRLFPQAISLLIDKQIWKSITRQIMMWLNDMRTKFVVLEPFTSAFQRALILLRYEEDYNLQWTDYLSVKTCV